MKDVFAHLNRADELIEKVDAHASESDNPDYWVTACSEALRELHNAITKLAEKQKILEAGAK